ncbi:hypothetical protein [Nostoc sp. C057]|uniref:DUF7219 family protein n=1 Tax=Nostoc sp. C057 TaxID=2576903 RepID=UPI0015C2D940|nr:hypothetical protein [Nostoc sp. C057]
MDESNINDKNKFLYLRSRYYGQVKPENLVFNANLQEFAHKVRDLQENKIPIKRGKL